MKNDNQELIILALKESGIVNPISITAIMAIVFKECNFIPRSEIDYRTASNVRIRQIFSRTNSLTELQLTNLKNDPVSFFDFVYGGRYGNAIDEGFKYRGRGFIQLTFRDNYKRYGDILGIDLVNNLDWANIPEIAAKITAAYMISTFKANNSIVKNRYKAENINDFNNKTLAISAFYNANAGFGNDTSNSNSLAKNKALDSFDSLYKFVSETFNKQSLI